MSAGTELTPAARVSADLDDLVDVISMALHVEGGNDEADDALDELVRRLNVHSNLTWRFERWWNFNDGSDSPDALFEISRRWLQVEDAFRAAMET